MTFKFSTFMNEKLEAEYFEGVICVSQNLRSVDNIDEAWDLAKIGKQENKKAVLEQVELVKETLIPSLEGYSFLNPSTILEENGRKKSPVTSRWQSYVDESGGSRADTTPKTDIISSDLSVRISVKKGASQLMSAGIPDTYATFKSALDENSNVVDSYILDDIKKNMKRFKSDSQVGDIKKMKPSEMDSVQKEIYDTVINNKSFKDDLVNFLKTHDDIKQSIVKEAMTGEIKFGKGDAVAEYLLVLDNDGKTIKKFKPIDDIVNAYASNIKIDFAFKSSHENKWNTFRLITESCSEAVTMINEGVIDSFKSFVQKVWNILLRKLAEYKDSLMSLIGFEPVNLVINCEY
jgi:hypothetical protein